MDDIKVTVLMPCYNAAAFIEEAVQSVLSQTFGHFELLIIDDGSADNTADLIKAFNDERIVLIHQQQQGIASALNNGLRHARADYIARFDADDICCPDRLEQQYKFMLANPDYMIVGSGAQYIDDAGNYIFTHFPKALTNAEIQMLSFHTCPFIHASVLYKKEPVARIGYNIHAHSFEDHLLWQQLKPAGKMCNLPEQLVQVRLNPGSVTMDEKKRPAAFHRIKLRALQSGQISINDGDRLLRLIKQQNNSAAKQGAYYSLLAKKFLWNNYNPVKARKNIKKAIGLNSFDVKDYLLLLASYLPRPVIFKLYSMFSTAK